MYKNMRDGSKYDLLIAGITSSILILIVNVDYYPKPGGRDHHCGSRAAFVGCIFWTVHPNPAEHNRL
ncbi:hypothetical protein [Mycobacterium uberis]|uniref:hypothetical protein n=1 Tax=Mycobacterium uberis TaxID=2162698 RepID=UPI00311DD8CB